MIYLITLRGGALTWGSAASLSFLFRHPSDTIIARFDEVTQAEGLDEAKRKLTEAFHAQLPDMHVEFQELPKEAT